MSTVVAGTSAYSPDRMRTCKLLLASVIVLNAQATLADHAVYSPPRLADGRPDLQGVWDHVDSTPFERPPGFATLAITGEQALAIERALKQVEEDRSTPTEPTEYFNERRMLPIRGELRSSVIIDPDDGRIPGTPEFKQWQPRARAAMLDAFDGPEQRPTSERCLGNPAAQPPTLNNPGTNLRQIVQTQDSVLIVFEVMHFARVIRLNASHAPAAVTSWPGDSIGWWQGDTLVVETKHFTPSDSRTLGSWDRIPDFAHRHRDGTHHASVR